MESARFIFTAPFSVNVETKDGEENVILDGLASTSDQDLVNDIVTKNCMESMQRQMVERSIKIDIEHESFRGGSIEEKEINKTKIPAGRITGASVEPLSEGRWGLRIKSGLNMFHPRSREIKGSVIGGFLDAYSIAFIPTKTTMIQKGGQQVRLLDDVRLLNVALTGNPINTAALNKDIFLKAIDAVEEYKLEKKDNPKIEEKLVVKSNDHPERDISQSYKEGNMAEETEEERRKKEEDEDKKKKEEGKAPKQIGGQQKSEFENSADSRLSAIEKELADIKAMKSDMAEIKAILVRPVMKSVQESTKQLNSVESKSLSPLDLIR